MEILLILGGHKINFFVSGLLSRDREKEDDLENVDTESNKADSETNPRINIEDDNVFIQDPKRNERHSQNSSKEFLALPEEHQCITTNTLSDSDTSSRQKPNHKEVTVCSRLESVSSSNSSWSSLSSSKQSSHCIVTDVWFLINFFKYIFEIGLFSKICFIFQ